MVALDFLNSSDLTALAGVVGMIVGGATLIASSVPNRSEALALRVRLVSPGAAAKASRPRIFPRLTGLERLRSLGGSLTEAERRQVVRTFSRVRVGADLAVPYFILVRLVAAAALGTIGFFAADRLVLFGPLASAPLLAAAGGAVAGWIAPVLWISRQLKRRTRSVATGLPNALELLVVCVEAGLSLEDGLQRIAHELKNFAAGAQRRTGADLGRSQHPARPDAGAGEPRRADQQCERPIRCRRADPGPPVRNPACSGAQGRRDRDAQRPDDVLGRACQPPPSAHDRPGDAVHHAFAVSARRRPGGAESARHVPALNVLKMSRRIKKEPPERCSQIHIV